MKIQEQTFFAGEALDSEGLVERITFVANPQPKGGLNVKMLEHTNNCALFSEGSFAKVVRGRFSIDVSYVTNSTSSGGAVSGVFKGKRRIEVTAQTALGPLFVAPVPPATTPTTPPPTCNRTVSLTARQVKPPKRFR